MTRQDAIEFLAKQIAETTEAQHQLDGNIDHELEDFGQEVRNRAWAIYENEDAHTCRECGEPCFVDAASGTAHHHTDGTKDRIDRDADADHVAIPEEAD